MCIIKWDLNGEELEEYKKYFGKVLIKYHKTFQQGCVRFGLVCDDLEVIDTNYYI